MGVTVDGGVARDGASVGMAFELRPECRRGPQQRPAGRSLQVVQEKLWGEGGPDPPPQGSDRGGDKLLACVSPAES